MRWSLKLFKVIITSIGDRFLEQKKSMEDIFHEKMLKPFKKRIKQLEKEKNSTVRTKLYYDIWADMFSAYIQTVSKLSNREFEKLLKERNDAIARLTEQIKKIGFEYVNSQGIGTLEEMMILAYQPTTNKKYKNSKLDNIFSNKDSLQRLFLLEFTKRIEFQLEQGRAELALKPLLELENLVKRRFDHDVYWCIAIAILATQENLVKKKLINLGVNEDELNKIEKDKKFTGLIDMLDKKIQEVEKRKVSLLFYKSSTLRELRNVLEHYGYEQPVTRPEVLDLLKDIKKFEMEIFET